MRDFIPQKMNLTAVTEESEVMTRHVEDSLAILPPLQRCYLSHCAKSTSFEGLNVVDVGSGAGLPGMILAIACPSNPFSPFVVTAWFFFLITSILPSDS